MTPRHVNTLAALVAAVLAMGTARGQREQPPSRTEPTPASAPVLPTPEIAVADVTEDQQRLLRATVTLAGAPLQGVRVNFGATRTFGVLGLGSDVTIEDGTAAVPFPGGLPGDASGQFEAVVGVEDAAAYKATTVRVRLGGAAVIVHESEPFPHALWSSKPLWPLVTVIVVLLTVVWAVYVFVVVQLVRLRQGEKP
jgi:hypothetical protein